MAVKRKSKAPPPKTATFEVNAFFNAFDIAKAGSAVTFKVYGPKPADSENRPVIGTLEIGQGSLNWKPRGKTVNGIRVKWDRLESRLKGQID